VYSGLNRKQKVKFKKIKKKSKKNQQIVWQKNAFFIVGNNIRFQLPTVPFAHFLLIMIYLCRKNIYFIIVRKDDFRFRLVNVKGETPKKKSKKQNF
jgi:hypothetical protein